MPGQKSWNHDLIFSLFQQPLASQIVNTEIIDDDGPALLCWDLTSYGICSSKSAYKLCLQELHNNPRNAPMDIPLDLKDFLKLIWKQKSLLPRVQTFAWRLLRRALPTGMRAGRFSVHISSSCCRCGQQEDEFHLFFLCGFARAAWFSSPWFIRADVLTQGHSSMHSILIFLINMSHPHASIQNVLNFLWCLWKARNDFLFDRKNHLPHQVNIAATTLDFGHLHNLHNPSSEQPLSTNHHSTDILPKQGKTLKSDLLIFGTKIFSDAAFRSSKIPGLARGHVGTGIGVYISMPSDQGEISIQVQASASSTSTPLQAEAVALSCAAHLAAQLNITNPTFLTDCLSLASAAASRNISDSPAQWNIRKQLATFLKVTSNLAAQVFHVSREINGVAHNLARQVFQSVRETQVACFAHAHSNSPCPVVALLSNFQLADIQLHTVHCF